MCFDIYPHKANKKKVLPCSLLVGHTKKNVEFWPQNDDSKNNEGARTVGKNVKTTSKREKKKMLKKAKKK